MKAWGCMDYDAECGVIVYAETRGRARSLAMTTDGLDTSDWNNVEVRRVKELDGKRPFGTVLDWYKDVRLYWEACWYQEWGTSSCDECGRFQYEEIPESEIEETDDGNICKACLADNALNPSRQPPAASGG